MLKGEDRPVGIWCSCRSNLDEISIATHIKPLPRVVIKLFLPLFTLPVVAYRSHMSRAFDTDLAFEMARRARLPSSWRGQTVGKRLTDARIRHYEAKGFYAQSFKDARKALIERKKAARLRREGNWVFGESGNLVYCPT